MKGDIIRVVLTEEYREGKKKRKLVKQYTETYVNDVLRVKVGIW
jgi:hypothetical protein